MNFSCPRSCPLVGKHWCKFNALFNAVGVASVHSHTVSLKVEMKDPDSLKVAVESMGGAWIGQGTHRLYAGQVTGYGFTLPSWKYCLVLGSNGQLSYDDYHGQWGNIADLERLKTEYAVCKAEQSAIALGWQCERTNAGLVVYHPSGSGVITITGQNADFTGFVGGECHSARLALGIVGDVENKPQASHVAAEIQVTQ